MSNLIRYSVADLSQKIKSLIENNLSYISLYGEVTNLKNHTSGHLYFCLKDGNHIIDAVMWKQNVTKLNFLLEDGFHVLGVGKISTFSNRSRYQIVLDRLTLNSAKDFKNLFEVRKKQYLEKGFFDKRHKKNLPFIPKVVVVISSGTGSVIHDILQQFRNRFFPKIYLFPVSVQGHIASKQITFALNYLNKLPHNTPIPSPSLIILARGGGSIEDLWCFNEDNVIQAIFNSKIPIISAIGHQTDVTLSDYVSDCRAATPSAAAEKSVPNLIDTRKFIESKVTLLVQKCHYWIAIKKEILTAVIFRIPSMHKICKCRVFRLLDMETQLCNNLRIHAQRKKIILISFSYQLNDKLGSNLIQKKMNYLQNSVVQINRAIEKYLTLEKNKNEIKTCIHAIHKSKEDFFLSRRLKIKQMQKMLSALSYTNTLKRGYCLASNDSGYISSLSQLSKESLKTIHFFDGNFKIN